MKKRNLKGMTLMEIIVSMAVYGVLALLLVEIMSCVNGTMQVTNQLNKRLAYEAKFADNRRTVDEVGNPLTATQRQLRIIYDGAPSGGVTSGAAEYTASYTNPNHEDDDRSAGTNYKYLVYTPPSTETPPQYFTMIIRVDDYPFDINSITPAPGMGIFEWDSAMSAYVNSKIPYPQGPQRSGVVTVNATVWCDMTSITGNVNKQVTDSHGAPQDSQNYPQNEITMTFRAWEKDSADNLTDIKSEATYYLYGATGDENEYSIKQISSK